MNSGMVLGFFRFMRNTDCKMHLVIGLLMVIAASSSAVAQEGGWAVVGRAGTLGIGAEVHRLLVPEVLTFRAGAQFFRYSTGFAESDISYSARLKLGTVPIGLDVYPFKNWFRLSGGLIINFNEVTGVAKPVVGQITINGIRYTVTQIGELDASIKFNRAAPFFGLGFGRTFKEGKHWGVTFDLGAMYHGQAGLTLTTTLPPSSQLQSDMRKQEQNFKNDAKDYTLYPIIQFGLSYRFGKTR